MDATNSITDSINPRSRWLTAGLVLILGALLLGMAYPRFRAALALVPGDAFVQKIHEGEQPLAKEELYRVISSRRAAAPWLGWGKVRTDMGEAEILLAGEYRLLDSEKYWALLHAAVVDLTAGLMMTPGDGFGWAQLSYALSLAVGDSPRTAAALENSMRFDPNAKQLAFWRLDNGLTQLHRLDESGRNLLGRQARIAWTIDPQTVRAIVQRRHAFAFARSEIAGYADQSPNPALLSPDRNGL